MSLFRFHRGSLEESLNTTVIVKDFSDLLKAILNSGLINENNINYEAKIEITPYPSKENNFDSRIGWYTQLVSANFYEEDKIHPIGFLSEPI